MKYTPKNTTALDLHESYYDNLILYREELNRLCSFEHVSCWLKIAYFPTPLWFGALAHYVPCGI